MKAIIGKCDVYIMPGVPVEMKTMFERDVLPHLMSRAGGAVILSRTLHTFGVGESAVGEMLGDLMKRGRNPSVGTTVSGGVVSLRLNARFGSRDQALQELADTEAACRERLRTLIYGMDDQTLPQAVAKLLIERRLTIATAESCTGGLLSGMLTEVPGSSAYFLQGYVPYCNEAKIALLGVDPETLREYGAVSEPVVKQMADGARQRSGADLALAISGIAGPEGGTPTKPVGTVCIGFAHHGGVMGKTVIHLGDRAMVRDHAGKSALTVLRCHLLKEPLPF